MKSTAQSQSNHRDILEILAEHEQKRGLIVEEYYNKFSVLIQKFEEICEQISNKTEQLEDYNNKKNEETTYLATMATQFYEKLQRALHRF
jgi:hypothetical protein